MDPQEGAPWLLPATPITSSRHAEIADAVHALAPVDGPVEPAFCGSILGERVGVR
jgi:hypothetical protein